ncbi:hypothetical protein PHMEG_00023736 [Phytophthora megakarya]|uniref:Uncharacterized protein n=1 Tax=Phytophthora megakarya TaxID=4795 RepID=A0A225VFN2_9STRA|nr:hypothetical protein PHMEG_00023736 [Phytophthora megakarya]
MGTRTFRWTGYLSEGQHSCDACEAVVATMLRTLSRTEQHSVALGFILSEQREVAAAITVSPGVTPRKEHLKLHVSSYEGK